MICDIFVTCNLKFIDERGYSFHTRKSILKHYAATFPFALPIDIVGAIPYPYGSGPIVMLQAVRACKFLRTGIGLMKIRWTTSQRLWLAMGTHALIFLACIHWVNPPFSPPSLATFPPGSAHARARFYHRHHGSRRSRMHRPPAHLDRGVEAVRRWHASGMQRRYSLMTWVTTRARCEDTRLNTIRTSQRNTPQPLCRAEPAELIGSKQSAPPLPLVPRMGAG